jgi:outer membrane protein
MKNLLLCLFVMLVLSAVTTSAQGIKVGIVDADVVIQKSAKGKKFFAEMQEFNQEKKSQLEGMVNNFESKQKDAQAKAASMNEEKRREVGLELQRLQTAIKRAQEDAERERQKKLNNGLERIQKELGPLIRQMALEKGLDLVLNRGAQSGIVFMSERINITNDVIRKYDELR